MCSTAGVYKVLTDLSETWDLGNGPQARLTMTRTHKQQSIPYLFQCDVADEVTDGYRPTIWRWHELLR